MADMNIKCADERAEKSTHNGCIGRKRAPGCSCKAKKDSAGATARHSPGRPADAVTKPLFIFYEISRRIGKMPMTADGERQLI